jgi:hypothetical protein
MKSIILALFIGHWRLLVSVFRAHESRCTYLELESTIFQRTALTQIVPGAGHTLILFLDAWICALARFRIKRINFQNLGI